MYLSDTEYQDLMKRVEQLESCLPVMRKLDAMLHDRVLGCLSEEERVVTVGKCGDREGFLDPALFVEVASHHSEGEIWLPDAHESLTLEEFAAFLQTWLKIIDDEDGLESLLTLGAVLMRKEHGRVTADLKQVRDIRVKLFKRLEELEEYV